MHCKMFKYPEYIKKTTNSGLQDTYTRYHKVMKSLNVYLESHVLQEEACSIILLIFIATASTDPQSNL